MITLIEMVTAWNHCQWRLLHAAVAGGWVEPQRAEMLQAFAAVREKRRYRAPVAHSGGCDARGG
jgi:hypothetical protein